LVYFKKGIEVRINSFLKNTELGSLGKSLLQFFFFRGADLEDAFDKLLMSERLYGRSVKVVYRVKSGR